MSTRKPSNERQKEITLSAVIADPTKTSFILPNQLTFNYCNISKIDQVPKKYQNIENLFLSHNKINDTIEKINQFENLKNLSLGYNKIISYNELSKLTNKTQIKCLRIKGNPLEKHPNHLVEILEMFPKLEQLDDIKIGKNFRKNYKIMSKAISKNLIMFLYRLEEDKNYLLNLRDKLMVNKHIVNNSSLEKNNNSLEKSFNIDKTEEENYKKTFGNFEKYTYRTNSKTNRKIQEKLKEKIENDEKIEKYYDFSTIDLLDRKLAGLKGICGKDLDVQGFLTQLSEITTKIYGGYDGIVVENKESVNKIYRKLFNEILTNMAGVYERRLEEFLVDLALEDPNVDQAKFAEDSEYAFESILFQFYKLQPVQAELDGVICFDKKNPLLDTLPSGFENNSETIAKKQCNLSANSLSYRLSKKKEEKNMWSFKKNEVENHLDLNENSPEILKNHLLVHFPLFPLNSCYLQIIHKIVWMRCEFSLRVYREIKEILYGGKARSLSKSPRKILKTKEITKTDNSFREQAAIHFNLASEKMSKTIKTESFDRNREKIEKNGEFPIRIIDKKTKKNVQINSNTNRRRDIYIEDQTKRQCNRLMKSIMKTQKKTLVSVLKQLKNFCAKKTKQRNQNQKGMIMLCDIARKFYKRTFLHNLQKKVLTKRKEDTVRILQTSRFFDIFYEQVQRQKKELNVFIKRNLLSKVFFGLLSLIYKRRSSIKKIMKGLHRKKNTKKREAFAKWRMWTVDQLCGKLDELRKIKEKQREIVRKSLKSKESSLELIGEQYYFSKNLQKSNDFEEPSTKETRGDRYVRSNFVGKNNNYKEDFFENSKEENSRFSNKELSKESVDYYKVNSLISKGNSRDRRKSNELRIENLETSSKNLQHPKYLLDNFRNSKTTKSSKYSKTKNSLTLKTSKDNLKNSRRNSRNSSLEKTKKKSEYSTVKRRDTESPAHCLDKCYFRKCAACYYQSYELEI